MERRNSANQKVTSSIENFLVVDFVPATTNPPFSMCLAQQRIPGKVSKLIARQAVHVVLVIFCVTNPLESGLLLSGK